jgi:hypothetical protein
MLDLQVMRGSLDAMEMCVSAFTQLVPMNSFANFQLYGATLWQERDRETGHKREKHEKQ